MKDFSDGSFRDNYLSLPTSRKRVGWEIPFNNFVYHFVSVSIIFELFKDACVSHILSHLSGINTQLRLKNM